uniref:Uncharacterized protein n=1 Tax=Caenorhabditis japonica TaxID=281687 RepID=A0A8R1E7R6_CAEJA
MPIDQQLKMVSFSALAIIITFVVWQRSPVLYVLTALAVVALILVDLYINPDTIPDEAKRFLALKSLTEASQEEDEEDDDDENVKDEL